MSEREQGRPRRWRGVSRFASGCGALPLLLIAVAAPAAFAQSGQDLRPLLDRMERLERDIRTLNIQLSRGGGGTPGSLRTGLATTGATGGPAVGRLEGRFSQLEDDIRATTGMIEQLGHQIRQVTQRLDKLVADVDYRLSALEQQAGEGGTGGRPTTAAPQVSAAPSPPTADALGGGPVVAPRSGLLGVIRQSDVGGRESGSSSGSVQIAPLIGQPSDQTGEPAPFAVARKAGVLPEGSARERYTYAFGLLRQAKYNEAELALKEFLDLHGDDPLAPNARYWLGESFYVREAYVDAAQTFLDGYQAAPDGPKAPDTLLKLGMSLARLEKTREACATFAKVATEFPNAPGNIRDTLDRERGRHGCP